MKNKKFFNFSKNILCEKHGGFAITLEVIATLAMMCVFLSCILYILNVMNVQRYMNTVMTSTASQASRWGGVNTKPYHDNVSETDLLTTAQNQLNSVASAYHPIIEGTPNYVTASKPKITITVKYSLPSVYESMSTVNSVSGTSYDMYNVTRNMSMQISIYSVMEPGKLLR